MTLHYAQPPVDVLKAAEEALEVGLRNRAFHVAPLRDARPGMLRLSLGRPVVTVGLRDILDQTELTELPIKAWQFSISSVSEPSSVDATLEMLLGEGELAPRMSSVSHSPFAASFAEVIATFEASDDATGADFEIRLLRAPALYLMALWLDAQTLPARFRVLRPAPPGIDTGRRYSWPELRRALAPLATKRQDTGVVLSAIPQPS